MRHFKSTMWVVSYIAVAVSAGVAKPIQRSQGVPMAAFVACVIGATAGIAWYAANPRPLAQRLTTFASVWAIAMLWIGIVAVVHLFGGDAGTVTLDTGSNYPTVSVVSLLAGLVLAEIGHRGSRSQRTRDDANLRQNNLSDQRHG